MQIIGIVAEWNPFHNGHYYLLQTIRAQMPEACVVGVMSGAFCQRGEAACFDKWTRTEMALAAGVDVVLELPQVYATASLEGFAHGGIASLLAFAPLHALYCGSETGDIALLSSQADYLRNHRAAYNDYIHTAANDGISYTEASQAFLQEHGFGIGKDSPNDRLALHYRLALPTEIPVHLVTRTVSHLADDAHGAMMSASGIRKQLPHHLNAVTPYLPTFSVTLMQNALANGWQLATDVPLWHTLQVLARGCSPTSLAATLHIHDGWEHRFLDAILTASDMNDFLAKAQTRHYSRSRIRRLILQWLSPLPQAPSSPPYCRVLGFSSRGRTLLRSRKGHCPCILNTAKDARQLSSDAKVLLESDIRRQNLADHLCQQQTHARDYKERPRMGECHR